MRNEIVRDMKKAMEYKELFNNDMDNMTVVYDQNGHALKLKDDEVFIQVYAEEINRNIFPEYWFVTNYGNLISYYRGHAVWIHPHTRDNGSKVYKFYKGSKLQSIEVHDLVALVHGSYAYGKAKDMIEELGVDAFGRKKGQANGHHKDNDHDNNHVDNIELVTDEVHDQMLHKIPEREANPAEVEKHMKAIGKFAKEEAPDKLTVVYTPDYLENGEWKNDNVRHVREMDEVKFLVRGGMIIKYEPLCEVSEEEFEALNINELDEYVLIQYMKSNEKVFNINFKGKDLRVTINE